MTYKCFLVAYICFINGIFVSVYQLYTCVLPILESKMAFKQLHTRTIPVKYEKIVKLWWSIIPLISTHLT